MKSLADLKKELKVKTDSEPEKYYPVSVLQEKGYQRKLCSSCGKYFWTLTEDDFCGEPECSGGYTFVGNPVGDKMDFIDGWRRFADLLRKRGYTPIKRYPTAARWRDDTDFVQASIYDFQPHVVSGSVDPPANPLVVPQYCVRFNSIDSVGITGRHNTGFVMIGQHAFFPEERFDIEKYFEDMLDWFLVGVRIPAHEIKVIESQWGGGGNLGVCMEFFARGLELANQVYMLYRITASGYAPQELRVLDMGMGQDRTPWVTQGTSTIYEVDYPDVCEKLFTRTGIRPDELFHRFVPHGSILDVDSPLNWEKSWNSISEQLGVEPARLMETVLPVASLFSVADHTQTLLVTLTDGVLPSNVGGGYNLRVILRRALQLIAKYGWDISLFDVCEWHARYLKPQYPELVETLEEVNEILAFEENRYAHLLKKSRKKIQVYLESDAEKEEGVERLFTLYESDGISPEMIKEVVEESGRKFAIPRDFYARLSGRHSQEVLAEDETVGELEGEGITPTVSLYYDGITEFEASVLKSWSDGGQHYAVLDRTAFYPKSGGQDSDAGYLNSVRVIGAEKKGSVIVHQVESPIDAEKVTGKVDKERRLQLTRHHTAVHIVNGAARKVLGKHVWQAGAEKTLEKARLDITHYDQLADEQLEEIEALSNRIIEENRKVDKRMMARTEAEKKYGFIIYQGGVVPGKELRIINIEGFDVEACGGLHFDETSKVERIKIFRTSKIQDGIVRLEFVAGNQKVEEKVREMELLAKKEEERAERKKSAAREKKEAKTKAKEAFSELNLSADDAVYLPDKTMPEIQTIGRQFVKDNPEAFVIIISDGIIFAVKGRKSGREDVGDLAGKAAGILGGRVGSKQDEWMGGGPNKERSRDAYQLVKRIMEGN